MENKDFIQLLLNNNSSYFTHFPDKIVAEQFIDELYRLLFNGYAGKYDSEESLSIRFDEIRKQFEFLLSKLVNDPREVFYHSNQLFRELPAIYSALLSDAAAFLEFDPAAQSKEEILLAYPGFYAIAVYRIAHQVYQQGIKLLPRIFSEYAHGKTGIDIHPAASIGKRFFIDHGTGIVIGETTIIGNDVKLYQGVTLGALNVSKEYALIKRHPTIQDQVVIYSGATILGGNTIIGRNSIVGGNVWLTYSVPEHSVVYHKSEIRVRDNNPFTDAINFEI